MSDAHPLLHLEDIEVRYPVPHRSGWTGKSNFRAVRGVNLTVKRGESMGLVGESGCGKSTLGRTALMLTRPSAGRVLFDNVDLSALKGRALRKIRSRMQMIFQDPQASLNPRMTTAQLVAEPYLIHHPGTARKQLTHRVHRLLRRVGLDPETSDRYPHEFSGGQRQRIAIARALSCDPEFIVADEPTSALDVSIQAQTLNLLMDLQQQAELTFLFISHNLKVVQLFCHSIAIMYLGQIVEIGPTAEVCSKPAHPYTEALLVAVPSLEAEERPSTLKGDVGNPMDVPAGCIFHPRCPEPEKVDRCFDAPPPLAKVRANHRAACHLAGKRLGL